MSSKSITAKHPVTGKMQLAKFVGKNIVFSDGTTQSSLLAILSDGSTIWPKDRQHPKYKKR